MHTVKEALTIFIPGIEANETNKNLLNKIYYHAAAAYLGSYKAYLNKSHITEDQFEKLIHRAESYIERITPANHASKKELRTKIKELKLLQAMNVPKSPSP